MLLRSYVFRAGRLPVDVALVCSLLPAGFLYRYLEPAGCGARKERQIRSGLQMIMQKTPNCPWNATVIGEYLLRLGNGQGWQLTATKGVEPEVGELARIMGLATCESNGYPRLIFVRKVQEQAEWEDTLSRQNKNMEGDLRDLGWEAYDLRVLRVWHHSDTPDLLCEMNHEEGVYEQRILSMRLALYPIYQQVVDSGGLPFHAGLVQHGDKGVLLAAPRNVGKSTSCRRLPCPWLSLCDEETLIVRDDEKTYAVHPFPTWSEYFDKRSNKSWNVERHVPLAAIFFLEQAAADEVIPLGQGEATACINHLALQVCYRYWADIDFAEMRSRRTTLLENICQLVRAVPAFRLRVSLHGRFWERIEKVLP